MSALHNGVLECTRGKSFDDDSLTWSNLTNFAPIEESFDSRKSVHKIHKVQANNTLVNALVQQRYRSLSIERV